jgi:hypothetical protein
MEETMKYLTKAALVAAGVCVLAAPSRAESGGTVVEKRPSKPDQPMVLKEHDFIAMTVEERGIDNVGSSSVELVEIELK